MLEKISNINAKFVSKGNDQTKELTAKVTSLTTSVSTLTTLVGALSKAFEEKKKKKEARACKKQEMKRKRPEDQDPDSQEGENERLKKQKFEAAQANRESSVPASGSTPAPASGSAPNDNEPEPEPSTAEPTEAQSSEIPTPTPLATGKGKLPSDPDMAQFILDLEGNVIGPRFRHLISPQARTTNMPPPPPRANLTEEEKRKRREEFVRKQTEDIMNMDDALREEEERKRKLAEEKERIEEEAREREREAERKMKEEEERAKRESSLATRRAVQQRVADLNKELRQKKFKTHIVQEITFRHTYAVRDEPVFLMLPNFANEFQVSDEVKERFMNYRLARDEAYQLHKIKAVAFKHVNFEDTPLVYTVYEVKRSDNKDYYLCDNDLLTINPADLLVLGKAMKRQVKEGGGDLAIMSYQRILACMRNFVTHRKQVDFQIGIDHHVTNLSISAPFEDREGIEHLHSGQLLSEPDGAVFRRNHSRCFFRVSEAHKYSDEVNEIIKSYASVVKADQSSNPELKATAERIFKRLDNLKKLREITTMFHRICSNHPLAPY